ncbi:MAG TPA: hypothetical protein VF240_02670 [Pyrinomonadaceae bacterium]
MKRLTLSLLAAASLAAVLSADAPRAQTQTSNSTASVASRPGAGTPSPEQIISAFSAKESEFRRALNEYQFKRDAVIQTIGMGGQITGEYKRVSRFVFDDAGNRFEKILHFPMSTVKDVSITPEDLEDLGGVQAFALEASQIGKYNISYVGKERVDELDLYIFDVAPKVMPNPKKTKERLFQGRIWVDDQDLQIVKARGKGVPETKESRYPTFETYRENIDGRYWFPTYSYADDELVFDSGQVVRLRLRVRYSDFEKLRGKVRIIEEGEPGVDEPKGTPVPDEPSNPTPTPTPSPAKPKP